MKFFAIVIAAVISATHSAIAAEGVLARCGASKGYGYFLYDEIMNPKGPSWNEDGISDGKILLVKLGDEWDIQFGDTVGEYGYRQDGAKVIPLGGADGKMTIGAFAGSYTDVYTFDFTQKEVVWSSHKIGTPIPKVGTYRANCSFVNQTLSME